MKRIILTLAVAVGFAGAMNAQLIDEKDVTVTLDLQPVLQLDMSTPNQIEFVFDEINEYYSGITQYAATILKVSSTVSWDLYAVGRSNGSNGAEFWDQQIDYGNDNPNAVADLPLSLLEIRQAQVNNGSGGAAGAFPDYSQPWSPSGTPSAGNSLYVNGGTMTPPTTLDKYIGGHAGTSGVPGADFLPGGSYLTQSGNTSDYYYALDYRIMPGLPAIFPNASDANGGSFEDLVTANASAAAYAEPGVYTMYVQYVLLEDQ